MKGAATRSIQEEEEITNNAEHHPHIHSLLVGISRAEEDIHS